MADELLYSLNYSTVLHVALLVYFRLLVVRNPLYKDQGYIRLRRIFIILIWAIPIAVEVPLGIGMFYDVKDLLDRINI